MDKEDGVQFLFKIANEIKRSFESPVILLTHKDYADSIFHSLIDMRVALLENSTPERIAEIVNTFHINWLQAVQDIDNFKKRVKATPRTQIIKAIDYTLECMAKRHKYFEHYIGRLHKSMTETEQTLIYSDLEIIKDLQEIVKYALLEKRKSLNNVVDRNDFILNILNETEELSNWLDRLNDYLAIQFCKVLDLKLTDLPIDLTETLQQAIEEMASYTTPEAQEVIQALSNKGKTLTCIARIEGSTSLEISKIVEKIKQLEDRISRMRSEKTTAGILALHHKTIFLEDRLESLQNLKVSLSFLKSQSNISKKNKNKKVKILVEDDFHIFNHLLPLNERCRLVDKLVGLWQVAILGDSDYKSMISILSAADIKEEYNDDLGNFTVDKHGRKIYKKVDNDILYQLNERNRLVPLQDDEDHVYFYDECGRYYLTENRARIYKAHATASEYVLDRSGNLLKVSEIVDGIEYRYDNLGRYYINEDGDHIYRENDSSDEYLADDFGNLVKVRNSTQTYETCPVEPIITEYCTYLKDTVGVALKMCLAEVVKVLPLDPIKYLADMLEQYSYNMKMKEKRLQDEEDMKPNRAPLKSAEYLPSSPFSSSGIQESYEDYNYMHYESHV